MTPEEMACWIASGRRTTRGSYTWKKVYDRALEAIQMTKDDALDQAVNVAAVWGKTKPVSGQDAKIIAAAMSSAGAAIATTICNLKSKP